VSRIPFETLEGIAPCDKGGEVGSKTRTTHDEAILFSEAGYPVANQNTSTTTERKSFTEAVQ